MGPARPFECVEVESTDGSAPGSGDVRRSCEETLPHLSGQVRESNEAAGNGSDVGGSAAPSEPVDGGDNAEGPDEALVALLQGLVPKRHYGHQHFVIRQAEVSTALGRRSPSPSSGFSNEADGPQSPRTGAGDFDVDSATPPRGTTSPGAYDVSSLLDLPVLPTAPRCRHREALVDYSKSILLTSEQYIETMELKAKKREEALVEAARRREETSNRRAARVLEKERKDKEKAQKAAEARTKENLCQQWTTEAIREVGERLQYLIKNPRPFPPPGSRIAPFCGILPAICKENMARRLAKRRCIKFGGTPAV